MNFKLNTMQLAVIGLGKMGKNLVLNMLDHGHQVWVWNRSPEPVAETVAAGAMKLDDLSQLGDKLSPVRVVWLMLPAGEVTGSYIKQVAEYLQPEDIIIDGANSFYQDTLQRADWLADKGIELIDAGVSGGPAGARHGACVMVGGKQSVVEQVAELFQDISVEQGWGHVGDTGAGHFVKMVHNGIEYGMMQAIGEGFEVLKQSPFELDLLQVAQIYNHGSVIQSRLIGWLVSGYQQYGVELEQISGSVKHSGEGQWTVETAHRLGLEVPVIEAAFKFRLESDQRPSYTGQVVSVLRNQFGGHQVSK